MYKSAILSFFISILAAALFLMSGGCAQIGFPTGGPRDTTPPVLLKADPPSGTTQFKGKKIVLGFNEYVDVQDIQKNLLVSPLMKSNPVISANLRTVTISFNDSLQQHTTYSIELGDAIRDINEGNILKNFSYVFSTGRQIDSLILSGKVVLAESGIVDSEMVVMLYRDLSDSAVQKMRPDFMTKVSGNGSFMFRNLPASDFRIYAMKDLDGSKMYNNTTKLFAFLEQAVQPSNTRQDLNLFAFQHEKPKPSGSNLPPVTAKKFTVKEDIPGGLQGLKEPLLIRFSLPVKNIDSTMFQLLDSNRIAISCPFQLDSTHKVLTLQPDWKSDVKYSLVIQKSLLEDSLGNLLTSNDTIRFQTRPMSYYGRIALRFTNYTADQHPVVQLLSGEEVKYTHRLTQKTWSLSMVPPGDYVIRVYFDSNDNGRWDTGDFSKKQQPEKAITISQKLTVRSDWDNERDISY